MELQKNKLQRIGVIAYIPIYCKYIPIISTELLELHQKGCIDELISDE